MLRIVLAQRFPGLYVPPIPPKVTMNNTDKEIVEERCSLLNLFFKQLVRCPYLYESEELKLFIRPHIDIEKALTLLPKLSSEQLLERTTRYYSFMGEINESKVQKQMNQVLAFVKQARALNAYLDKFKETVNKLEIAYDLQWALNSM